MLASDFQFISCTKRGIVGNKNSKSLFLLFKFKFELIVLSKTLSASLFKIVQLITIAQNYTEA